ncbi:hypothetical protein [Natranaerofaba carboxydovora]|uniref:hypothetical protein n=1 Tax=Natranaerofaba carboxydovora TaxID=2742683 RepID=UPI001F13F0E5|nr:hypothetical protein [Natranaerofaba carboxydovora]UMZ72682.1 hypothetical protein ACONDI_00207 [Natranaerofaba carboxydovora]
MESIFELNSVLAAFAGGVFGTSIGGLSAFLFCGFLILAGELIVIAGGPETFTTQIGLGPLFGPHVAFAAATVAAAYAGKKGYLDTGVDILTPLIKFKDWRILAVGGIFGIIGYLLGAFFTGLDLPTDVLALTIVLLQISARLIWGNTGIFGEFDTCKSDCDSRWKWDASEEGCWVPAQRTIGLTIILGLGVGVASGYMVLMTDSVFIGFGFAGFLLILLQTIGVGPVTHHIALPAALATAATGSLIVGGVFGIIAAFAADLLSRAFTDWADTYIDPPACSILVVSTLVILVL